MAATASKVASGLALVRVNVTATVIVAAGW